MAALRRALIPLLFLPLVGCEESTPRVVPSAFDWANEGPSGAIVRRSSAAGLVEEQFRVSRSALRYYEGPGEKSAHLRAGASGLEFLTADGRVWCRGEVERASRAATLRCDGFAVLRVEAAPRGIRVLRDGALWGELTAPASGPAELRTGEALYRFTRDAGAWVATDSSGKPAGALAGWSRGAGAPLLWLELPQPPGFGDDRWRALRAAAAWLASAISDPASAAVPTQGSGQP